MSNVKLIWVTPDAEKLIVYCARVSSPHQDSTAIEGLLKYCIKHGHWSILEQANMCLEINTSRAISAQIIRHRSFSFQEFSQRYAQTTDFLMTEARRQDVKNRQNSIDDLDNVTKQWWEDVQNYLGTKTLIMYEQALAKGIAKECARMLLPMSSATKIYMNGTLRSWMHYFKLRCDESTQLEHREIALEAREIFRQHFPILGELL